MTPMEAEHEVENCKYYIGLIEDEGEIYTTTNFQDLETALQSKE